MDGNMVGEGMRVIKNERERREEARATEYYRTCRDMLQCVAECCSELQCVAVCCSVLQCIAACFSVMQRVAVFCSVLQRAAVCFNAVC